MYLLLDHIKGKNYLLYKKRKKRVLYNFHCSMLYSLAVATWLVPNSLYTLICVNYF